VAARSFNDFSKLPKGLFRAEREELPRSETAAKPSDDGADALAYFGLSGGKPRVNANRFVPPPKLPDVESAPLG